MLYPGCSAPHWRNVFLGKHCGQAFFHYAPAVADTFGAYFGDTERGQTASWRKHGFHMKSGKINGVLGRCHPPKQNKAR